MDAHLREYLRPQPGLVVVHHDPWNQTGIDHLQQVLVLQVLVRGDQLHGRQAALGERKIQRLEVLVVAAPGPHENLPSRQLVDRPRNRLVLAGDQNFADAIVERPREIHLCFPGRGDGEVGCGDVPAPLQQPGDELVARHRHRHHVDLLLRPGEIQPRVEIPLELLDALGDHAALATAVQEVEGLAVDHQRPDDAPLLQAVQVVGVAQILERLEQGGIGMTRRGRKQSCQKQQDGEETAERGRHRLEHWRVGCTLLQRDLRASMRSDLPCFAA